MRIFLGVTGASGAPYAERLLRALVAADCEVGLSASRSGIEVIATELYRDPSITREEVLERFVGAAGSNVTVYGESDFKSPYASGSARVDGYVVCPCSMATVGTLASGAMQNLIHRAASVALKERRKLVLVPRETPLSSIHLRGLATLNEAGAVILFAAPGFYHAPETIDDLVDFLVARCLDQLGIENVLAKRWGESCLTRRGGCRPTRCAGCSTASPRSTT
ncbi:MAG: UbiX family flavin prenyltransferase [Actinomycetota bacterium]|nr:UbiX family flavin prenyltransferase [Actinomycetota bacterium]